MVMVSLSARATTPNHRLERAPTSRLHALDVELKRAARGVEAHARADDHLHAVAGAEDQHLRGAPEHDHRDLALVVLQREVEVAGGCARQVRDFATHPGERKTPLQRVAHASQQFRHRKDA